MVSLCVNVCVWYFTMSPGPRTVRERSLKKMGPVLDFCQSDVT